MQLSIIFRKLKDFLNKDYLNSIEFWDCSSHGKWAFHNLVNIEIKKFNLVSIFPYKSSWDFNRKNKYDKLLDNWKMMF